MKIVRFFSISYSDKVVLAIRKKSSKDAERRLRRDGA